jgi:murein DD-endopeptidase MepM/ murein hydrolase activator NlpD
MTRWARLVAVVALAGAVALPARTIAAAQQSDDLGALSRRLDEATAAQQSAQRDLDTIRAQRQQADAVVAQYDLRVAAADGKVVGALVEVQRIEGNVEAVQSRIAETQGVIDKVEGNARQAAVLMYQQGGHDSTVSLLTGKIASASVVEGTRYLTRVSEVRRNDLQKLGHARSELAAEKAQLAVEKKSADDAATAAAAEKAKADELRAEQAKARDDIKAQENLEQAAVVNYKAEAAQAQQELSAASARIEASYSGGTVDPNAPKFTVRPVPGAVASPYGSRTDPITGAQSFHPGVDLAASCGTPIKAPAAGTVKSTQYDGGYGNETIIDHGGGWWTLYGHQSAFRVSPGQQVNPGDVIGLVGTTGYSTGCHLHWEVRAGGKPVNPMPYLPPA